MEEISVDIFNLFDEQPAVSRGNVIVAKPTVEDACFKRSAIVLVDHDSAKGTMGLMVNRFTDYTLHDVLPELDNSDDIPLYMGGPVNPEMMFFLHTLGPEIVPGCIRLARGLYFGGDYEAVKAHVAGGDPVAGHLKFILGYSGWTQGQLAGEIARHDWAVLKQAEPAMLMAEAEESLWRNAVEAFGEKYRMWLNWPREVINN